MKKTTLLLVALLFVPLLASAKMYYYTGVIPPQLDYQTYNATYSAPTIAAVPKTQEQLLKELQIALLQLRVTLYRMQIAQM